MKERKYTRVEHQTKVEVYFKNNIYTTTSEDISLRGIKIKTPKSLDLSINTPVKINIYGGNKRTEVDGKIAFLDETFWGITFTHIEESSLKNLIILLKQSSQDDSQINSDVSKMILRVC
ncbi:MAG: PilZ domain-containing protein [Spirochaetaceae bacterium]|jgi:hypothetical protein|nr:PilZ domain-containing protein [Spirochaetaceae bacterium]